MTVDMYPNTLAATSALRVPAAASALSGRQRQPLGAGRSCCPEGEHDGGHDSDDEEAEQADPLAEEDREEFRRMFADDTRLDELAAVTRDRMSPFASKASLNTSQQIDLGRTGDLNATLTGTGTALSASAQLDEIFTAVDRPSEVRPSSEARSRMREAKDAVVRAELAGAVHSAVYRALGVSYFKVSG